MIKVILSLFMMIPLCFYFSFWFNQFVWFIIRFIFLLNFSCRAEVTNLFGEIGLDLLSYVLILLSF